MNRLSASLILSASVLLAACGESAEAPAPSEGSANHNRLLEIRGGVHAETPEAPAEEMIDPSAQNIDPFRYGLGYNYEERDVLAGLLDQARERDGYLLRSLAVTADSLALVRPGKTATEYERALTCAVKADLLGRNGGIPVHRALNHSIMLSKLAVTLTEDEIASEAFQTFQEEFVEFEETSTAHDRFLRNRELQAEENRLRTRHYLNYHLLRDQVREEVPEGQLQGDVTACLEMYGEDIAAIEAAEAEAEAEERG